MVRERLRHGLPGIPVLVFALVALGGIVWLFFSSVETRTQEASVGGVLTAVGLIPLWIFLLKGFFMVAPNEAKVLQLFGDYVGTAKVSGLRYANPLPPQATEMALQMLAHKGIVTLDEGRKAAMVSNLLVVLCGSKDAQPIVNTGTIHQ